MDRRAFIAGAAASVFVAPLAGEAQPVGKVYRIGIIVAGGEASDAAGAEPRR